jgi:hypothetical protein
MPKESSTPEVESKHEEPNIEEAIESDKEMYDSIENTVVTRDWVGPVTVDLEFWEPGPSNVAIYL